MCYPQPVWWDKAKYVKPQALEIYVSTGWRDCNYLPENALTFTIFNKASVGQQIIKGLSWWNPERHNSCPFIPTFLTGSFKVDLIRKEALLDFFGPTKHTVSELTNRSHLTKINSLLTV